MIMIQMLIVDYAFSNHGGTLWAKVATRASPAAPLGLSALFFVVFFLAPTPRTLEASATEIISYSTEHHGGTLIAAFLFAATVPLFIVWAGALAARLCDAEGEGAWLYLVFPAGVIITMAANISASFILDSALQPRMDRG